MFEDDNEYQIKCGICDSETDITVHDNEERPCFCPMCGEQCDGDQS